MSEIELMEVEKESEPREFMMSDEDDDDSYEAIRQSCCDRQEELFQARQSEIMLERMAK